MWLSPKFNGVRGVGNYVEQTQCGKINSCWTRRIDDCWWPCCTGAAVLLLC